MNLLWSQHSSFDWTALETSFLKTPIVSLSSWKGSGSLLVPRQNATREARS